MRAFVGVTDSDWFDLLSAQRNLTEINFWQPGGTRLFKSLQPGELFLFKPHRRSVVCGGGVFAHSTLLPISLAWEAFGIGNGASTLEEMRTRVERYRRAGSDALANYTVGCILLEEPFFLKEPDWVPLHDWSPNIVSGKRYDLTTEAGRALWSQLQLAARRTTSPIERVAEPAARYGSPVLVAPRLGQGGFRVLVTDAYERRCSITGERTLPVLEAAHIRPYGMGGSHQVSNGLLLRSDLHVLFDRGYLTVTADRNIEVSRRIKEEFSNGRDYYAHHGKPLRAPVAAAYTASAEALAWHNENVFRG